jgi:hypothetical protein
MSREMFSTPMLSLTASRPHSPLPFAIVIH